MMPKNTCKTSIIIVDILRYTPHSTLKPVITM
jgi:hypothetical protein